MSHHSDPSLSATLDAQDRVLGFSRAGVRFQSADYVIDPVHPYREVSGDQAALLLRQFQARECQALLNLASVPWLADRIMQAIQHLKDQSKWFGPESDPIATNDDTAPTSVPGGAGGDA